MSHRSEGNPLRKRTEVIGERATDANCREKTYRHILRELNDLVIECTGAGIIREVYGNVRLTGYTELELLGRPISALFSSQPFGDKFSETVESSDTSGRIFKGTIQQKDGSITHLAISMSRIVDDPVHAVVLTVRDVTRKMEMNRQHSRLMKKVRESERLAYLGSLVQGMAHNLQGSMASILGRTQMLSLRYPDEREMEELVLSTKNMAETVRSLLIKVSGEQQSSEQELDLNEILKSELRVLESDFFFKHKVEKQYYFDKQLPVVRGIYGDFSQSFTNVIRNAVEAMRDAPRKRLLVATSFDNDYLLIAVSDTGKGIDEKNLDKIFEPSFTTKTVKIGDSEDFSGLGLGLASVKELLSSYGVKFEVKNNPEAGVIFRFRIPYEKFETLDEKTIVARSYDRIGKVIRDAEYLPTIPDMLYEVINVTAVDPDVSVRSLVPIIENDYSLTEKIFAVVNSAHYALRAPISNLSQAISYIGFQELRNICFALLARQIFGGGSNKQFIAEMWNHSLAAAVAARTVMEHLNREIEHGYIAALLHDLGRMILMENYDKLAVNKRLEKPDRLDRREEFARFRTTHDAVGSWFVKEKTRLPESIRQAVAEHHAPFGPDTGELTRLVALADGIVHDRGKGDHLSDDTLRLGAVFAISAEELRSVARRAAETAAKVKESYRLHF